MIKLVVNGACGHMGRTIIRLALEQPEKFQVLCGVDIMGAGESEGVPVVKSFEDAPHDADVLIDFSRPEAAKASLAYCLRHNIRLVVGTTGLDALERAELEGAKSELPIFFTGNMSIGVNLQIELIKTAAATLGDRFDVEIVEAHHNRKIDAPSGTALMLADAVSSQYPSGRTYVCGRHSKDCRRTKTEIGIHALRGGTVVGEHEVFFYGQDEVINIGHKAYSKQVFAAGALRAAAYLMQKEPGLYNMHDIVTERNVLSHLYLDAEQAVITISALPNQPGVLSAVFTNIANHNVFVDMISTTSPGSSGEVSFSLPQAQLTAALEALEPLRNQYADMHIHALSDVTKVTVEGAGMAFRHGVAGKFFELLAAAQVGITLVTTSETKISCCVKNSDVTAALDAIREGFHLEK